MNDICPNCKGTMELHPIMLGGQCYICEPCKMAFDIVPTQEEFEAFQIGIDLGSGDNGFVGKPETMKMKNESTIKLGGDACVPNFLRNKFGFPTVEKPDPKICPKCKGVRTAHVLEDDSEFMGHRIFWNCDNCDGLED